ncbi:MAG: DegT/DnrJ/EryC1/StrS family aminotransferase [Thermodesulfobacteriota bacterium]
MMRRLKKVIPKHSSCLDLSDYMVYLRSGFTPCKDQVIALEKVWEKVLGNRKIVPTPTGRHALWSFLDIAGLKKGDEVLVSAYNFYVVIRLIIQKGLVPVFVDIEPETLCMDPDDLARKITDRSRLVLVTHMFGTPADLKRITLICKQNNLLLFEDCAHAVGTYCGTDHIGHTGDGALFSFGIYKLVNTFGGGMLVLRDSCSVDIDYNAPNLALTGIKSFLDNFIRSIFSVLMTPTLHTFIFYPLLRFSKRHIPGLYQMIEPSGNDPAYLFEVGNRAPFKPYMQRMIKQQLAKVEGKISRRREIAERINSGLKGVDGIRVLHQDRHGRANCSYFGIYVPDPEDMARHLEDCRIVSNPHEYYDCSNLPQFSEYKSYCKHANYAEKHILRLPNYSCLCDEEVEHILLTICSFK